MGVGGLERPSETPVNPHIPEPRGTESGTLDAENAPNASLADPDLARLVNAWPGLPPAIRARIVAMLEAATQRVKP